VVEHARAAAKEVAVLAPPLRSSPHWPPALTAVQTRATLQVNNDTSKRSVDVRAARATRVTAPSKCTLDAFAAPWDCARVHGSVNLDEENRTRGSAFGREPRTAGGSMAEKSMASGGKTPFLFLSRFTTIYIDHRRGELIDGGASRNNERIDNALLLGGHRTRALPHAPRVASHRDAFYISSDSLARYAAPRDEYRNNAINVTRALRQSQRRGRGEGGWGEGDSPGNVTPGAIARARVILSLRCVRFTRAAP